MRGLISGFCMMIGFSTAMVSAATVGGTVTSSAGGAVIAGATVVLTQVPTGGYSDTAVTDTAGNYGFIGVPVGNFALTVSKTGYTTAISQVRVTNAGANITQDVVLTPQGGGAADTGIVNVTVTNSVNGRPIAGARLILTLVTGTTITIIDSGVTDTAGRFQFDSTPIPGGLGGGRLNVTASAAGFQAGQGMVTFVSGVATVNIALTPLVPIFNSASARGLSWTRLSDGGLRLKYPELAQAGWVRSYLPSGALTFSLALPAGSSMATLPAQAAGEDKVLTVSLGKEERVLRFKR